MSDTVAEDQVASRIKRLVREIDELIDNQSRYAQSLKYFWEKWSRVAKFDVKDLEKIISTVHEPPSAIHLIRVCVKRNLENLSVKDLRVLACEREITGYQSMSKETLVTRLAQEKRNSQIF